MDKSKLIYNLYFDKKMTLTEISKVINTSISYISRILKKDERYKNEKELRKIENSIDRRKKQKNLIYKKREEKKANDYIYNQVINEHNQAVKELSKKSVISKTALRKYCPSAYIYNKEKNRFEFDTQTLLKPADFPLYIDMKI